jgi:hypothetical protein
MTNSFESSWASVSPPSAITPKSDAPARKRLVPKKSKLGLLSVGSKAKDFSEAGRQVGTEVSPSRAGFEIFVDPIPDPELDDVLVIKKQKSRGALNDVNWGALGEVTNNPNLPRDGPMCSDMLRTKDEDKKWWTIGRGRKDSKDKGKGKGSEEKDNAKRAKCRSFYSRSRLHHSHNFPRSSRDAIKE